MRNGNSITLETGQWEYLRDFMVEKTEYPSSILRATHFDPIAKALITARHGEQVKVKFTNVTLSRFIWEEIVLKYVKPLPALSTKEESSE